MDDLYTFQFTGGPIDNPDQAGQAWIALGHAAAAWARLEQQIDALLFQLNKAQHSEELYNPEHPIAFGNKIKMLKRWFNQHPALKERTQDIRDLTSRLKSLGAERNAMLHSILEGYSPDTETLTFRSLRFEGDGNFKIKLHKTSLKSVSSFAAVTNTANKWLWEISSELFTPDGIERLRKPE